MSKELTPLEAVEELKQNNKVGSHLFDDELLDIIEAALKDYEMEHTLRIRLENINYELVREKQVNEKKLKALEIIKRCNNKCPDYNKIIKFSCYDRPSYMAGENLHLDYLIIGKSCFFISPEEYDLLKEILK